MKSSDDDLEMRKEYDFSKGVRNPYAERFRAGSNLVLLDPDVAAAFPDSDAVNDALRVLLRVGESVQKLREKQAS